MSPIPDDPGKNQDDINESDAPQFLVNIGSESDSEDDDPSLLGYQPLPQEIDGMTAEGASDLENHISEEVLDKTIIRSLDQSDLPQVSQTQSQHDQSTCISSMDEECIHLWNEHRLTGNCPMAKEEADKIRAAMAGFTLPVCNHPEWAKSIPEEDWKLQLFKHIKSENKDKHSQISQTNSDKTHKNSER